MKKIKNKKITKKLLNISIITILLISFLNFSIINQNPKKLGVSAQDYENTGVPEDKDYPPNIYNIPNQGIKKGQTYVKINLGWYVFDIDTPHNWLKWEITGNKEITYKFSEITDPDTEKIEKFVEFFIPPSFSGYEKLTLIVSDPQGYYASDSIAFISPDENEYMFKDGSIENVHITCLDDKHFVVGYSYSKEYRQEDIANLDTVVDEWSGCSFCDIGDIVSFICVGTINSDKTMSFSEPIEVSGEHFKTINWDMAGVTALDSKHFLVFIARYEDASKLKGGAIWARMGVINDDGSADVGGMFDMTFIAGVGREAQGFDFAFDASMLDSQHFALTYVYKSRVVNGDGYFYRWNRATTIGCLTGENIELVGYDRVTTATSSDPRDPDYGYDDEGFITAKITALDSTRFVVVYKKHTAYPYDSDDLYAQVYTFTGEKLVKGDVFKQDYCTSFQDVDTLDESHVIVAYNGFTCVLTINDDEIVFGQTAYCPTESIVALNPTSFVAIPSGYAQTGEIVKGSINFGVRVNFNTGKTSAISTDNLDKTHYVVAYSEEGIGMLTVQPPLNNKPKAYDDIHNVLENTMLYIKAPGILENDVDLDGDDLTFDVEKLPIHGSLLLNSDGSFYYTPETDYVGVDEFTYKVYDGKEYSEIATVRIIVSQQSDFNNNPDKPSKVQGPDSGQINNQYIYCVSTTDSDNDNLFYMFDWDDGTTSGWLGQYNSGDLCTASHLWTNTGTYSVKVKAKDSYGDESDWSETFQVTIGEKETIKSKFLSLFIQFLQNHPGLKIILNIISK